MSAKTNAQKQADLRARRAAENVTEVRGLYAKTEHHAEIKQAARKVAAKLAKRKPASGCAKEVAPSSDHRSNPNDYIAGEDGIELLDAVVEKIRARYGIKE